MTVSKERSRAWRGQNPIIAAAVALALGMVTVRSQAGTAYISVQGSFSAVNKSQTFDFVPGINSTGTMRTWGRPGGTNAAGDVIPDNGIDSLLNLSRNGNPILSDDDGGGGLNSMLILPRVAGDNYTLE